MLIVGQFFNSNFYSTPFLPGENILLFIGVALLQFRRKLLRATKVFMIYIDKLVIEIILICIFFDRWIFVLLELLFGDRVTGNVFEIRRM